MKDRIISAIKLIIPLSLGVFLIWYFYDALGKQQKVELFTAFKEADYLWVLLSLVCGFLSHLSRAYRWRFLLQPLGYKPTFWNCYHSVMIGYIINYVLPRAGEASRAGSLARYEKVPFSKGFGTILAERTVDLLLLGIIALATVGLQLDKIDLFQKRIDEYNKMSESGQTGFLSYLGYGFLILVIIGIVSGGILFLINSKVRERITSLWKGFLDGVKSIFNL